MTTLEGDLHDRFSRQLRLFEAEQHYRRGCEYLYGMNGYGEGGEHLSKKLGLSELQLSADCGHADAQFRYGQCLFLVFTVKEIRLPVSNI
jgi:TPR repeat protein